MGSAQRRVPARPFGHAQLQAQRRYLDEGRVRLDCAVRGDRGHHREDVGQGVRHADVEAAAGAGGASLWARGDHVGGAGRPDSGGQEEEEGQGGAGAAGLPAAGKVLRGVRQTPGGAVVGMLPIVRACVLSEPKARRLELERQF